MNFGQWAAALLAFGSWPVTQEKLVGIVSWAVAEGSPCSCNPLDTTEPAHGSWKCNYANVQSYPSVQIGIEATFATLHNGYYPGVLAVLADEGAGAYALAAAVGRSPWGTGNFSRVVDTVKANPAPYFAREVHGSGPDPLPPTPEGAENVTSIVSGGYLHVFGEINGKAYHWFQPDPFPPGHTPVWNVELLPTLPPSGPPPGQLGGGR